MNIKRYSNGKIPVKMVDIHRALHNSKKRNNGELSN